MIKHVLILDILGLGHIGSAYLFTHLNGLGLGASMLHGFIFAHTNVTFAPLLHIVTSNLVLLAELFGRGGKTVLYFNLSDEVLK